MFGTSDSTRNRFWARLGSRSDVSAVKTRTVNAAPTNDKRNDFRELFIFNSSKNGRNLWTDRAVSHHAEMRNAEFPITWARNKKSEKSRYRIFGLYATLSCCQVFLRPTEIRKTL